MADLLVASYTDPHFEDLIEKAFLEGQIDGPPAASAAYFAGRSNWSALV